MMRTTEQQLRDIPDLYADLGHFHEPGTKPHDPNSRTTHSNPSKPTVDLDVLDLADTRLKPGWIDQDPAADPDRRMGIYPTLWLWYFMLITEMNDDNYPGCEADEDTVLGLCSWMRIHLPWIRQHHDDFDQAIHRMHTDLKRTPDPYQPTCPDCGHPVIGQDNHSWWQCTGCPRTWQHDAEIRRMFGQQRPLPLRQIAPIIGVSHMTLQRWWKQGRFMPAGRDRRGNLFHIEIVQKAAATVNREHKRA